MELAQIETQRTGLVQFLIVLIMIFLGLILYIAHDKVPGYTVPTLAVLSLLSCLYVMAKERRLVRQHNELASEVRYEKRHVGYLDKKLKAERTESEQFESQLKELLEIYRALMAVNETADPKHTSDAILRAALDLVGGDCGSVMMLDEGRKNLSFAAMHGLAGTPRDQKQPVADGIAGWVATHGEPVLIDGKASEDPRFSNLLERHTPISISMSVPLKIRGEVCGVLNLGITEAKEKANFDEEDLRSAAIFAQHAAMALENARLHRDLAVLHSA